MVGIQFCPECGEELVQGSKTNKGIVSCSECGDSYVDLDP